MTRLVVDPPENARALVEDGGFVRSDTGDWPDTPFNIDIAWADVRDAHSPHCDCGTGDTTCPVQEQVLVKAGVVTVVEAHHADECYNHDAATIRALAKVPGEQAARIGFGDFCHPDAMPDEWHLHLEPVKTYTELMEQYLQERKS